MENTKIDWCDHTVNLWWGCSKVHTGCKNCYAEKQSHRWGNDVWGESAPRKLIKSYARDLGKYQRQAEKEGRPIKVFIGSMMDIFEEPKSIIGVSSQYINTGTLRSNLFYEISKGKYPNIIFLFLTKRPGNISRFVPPGWITGTPPGNVWVGCSISDNDTHWDMRYGILNSGWPGNVFYSIEPQIEPIGNLDLRHVGWVIQGAESGSAARPFEIGWADQMREVCSEQDTPLFLKQVGKGQKVPGHLDIKEYPDWPKIGLVL